jgi:hypothetical protein
LLAALLPLLALPLALAGFPDRFVLVCIRHLDRSRFQYRLNCKFLPCLRWNRGCGLFVAWRSCVDIWKNERAEMKEAAN